MTTATCSRASGQMTLRRSSEAISHCPHRKPHVDESGPERVLNRTWQKRIRRCIRSRRLQPLRGSIGTCKYLDTYMLCEAYKGVESVFEIIAEPNRRAILSLLVSSEQSVGEIERQLRMPQPTV